MDMHLRILLIVMVVFLLIVIIHLLRKDKLELRYTLLWLGSILAMSIVIAFPEIIFDISTKVGIINPVNLVFFIQGIFVVIILLSITSIVSNQNKKIRSQAQAFALLEEKIRKIELCLMSSELCENTKKNKMEGEE